MLKKPPTEDARVLLVRNAAEYDFGGAERLIVHISHELSLNGLASIVISTHTKLLAYAASQSVTHHKGVWWSKQNWDGKNVVLFPVYLAWQIFLTIWYLQFIARNNIKAVHLFSKDDFIAGTLAAKILGKNVVWTDCADLKHIFKNHQIWYKNPVGKLVYRSSKLADCVTLVSNSENSLIEESLGKPTPSNFKVIHIAGKDEPVTPAARSDADKDAVVFCSTSRLVVAKGIGELIDAFHALSSTSEQFRLWLVGEGPDEEMFREQAKDNKYIIFLGHQDKPLTYVAAADVFVHPTHHEGFSLSLAEAAMLGKPMVASNVGGNPELVNESNGVLFPAQDKTALKDAMSYLAADQLLRQNLGGKARRDYVNNFDFATIVQKKLIPLYEKHEKN